MLWRVQESWTLPVSEVNNYLNTVQFLVSYPVSPRFSLCGDRKHLVFGNIWN